MTSMYILCDSFLKVVKTDNLEDLEFLLAAHRFRLYWFPPKDTQGEILPPRPLTETAARYGAVRCLNALCARHPRLPSPLQSLIAQSWESKQVLSSLRVLLESKQTDPNGLVSSSSKGNVPWVIQSIEDGRFQTASLLLEQGAAVDVWDWSYESDPRTSRASRPSRRSHIPSGQSPLHALLQRADASTPSYSESQGEFPQEELGRNKMPPLDLTKKIVERSKDSGSLEWVGKAEILGVPAHVNFHTRVGLGELERRAEEGSALVLTAKRVASKGFLCAKSDWHVRFFKELLDAGASVGCVDKDDLSPLHWLCRAPRVQAERESEVERGRGGESVSEGVLLGLLNSVLSLASVPLLNSGPVILAFVDSYYTPVIAAAERGRWTVVSEMIQRGACVDRGRSESCLHETLLHLACSERDDKPMAPLSVLSEILSRSRDANPWTETREWETTKGKGRHEQLSSVRLTPMAYALSNSLNKPETVEVIKKVARSEKLDLGQVAIGQTHEGKLRGFNAAEWCLRNGHTETAFWFLQTFPPSCPVNPAEVVRSDPEGALEESLKLFDLSLNSPPWNSVRPIEEDLLFMCVRLDAVRFLSRLMHPDLCPENAKQFSATGKGTLVHVASQHGAVNALSFLLERGADANIPSLHLEGATPIMMVGQGMTLEDSVLEKIIEMLGKAGASVLKRDTGGRTVFSRVIASGLSPNFQRKLELLLSLCPSDEGQKRDLQSVLNEALEMALTMDLRNLVEMLLEKGGAESVEYIVHSCPSVLDSLSQDRMGRKWLRSLFLERHVLSADTKVRVMEILYRFAPILSGLFLKSLDSAEREVKREKNQWESGCVNCDFVFRSDHPLYGGGTSRVDTGYIEEPSVVSLCGSARHRSREVPERKADLSTLRVRLEKSSSAMMNPEFVSKQDAFAELDRLVGAEAAWWDGRLRSMWALVSSQAPELEEMRAETLRQERKKKEAHVRATRWCVEKIKRNLSKATYKYLLKKAKTEHPYRGASIEAGGAAQEGEDGQIPLVEIPFDPLAALVELWPPSADDCEGNLNRQPEEKGGNSNHHQGDYKRGEKESASKGTETSPEASKGTEAPPDASKGTEAPPVEALLNLRLYRVTEKLVDRVQKAENAWVQYQKGVPSLCFPFSLRLFRLTPEQVSLQMTAGIAFEGTVTPFVPTKSLDSVCLGVHHHLAAMSVYKHKSFEELRAEDYAQGRKGRSSSEDPSTAREEGEQGGNRNESGVEETIAAGEEEQKSMVKNLVNEGEGLQQALREQMSLASQEMRWEDLKTLAKSLKLLSDATGAYESWTQGTFKLECSARPSQPMGGQADGPEPQSMKEEEDDWGGAGPRSSGLEGLRDLPPVRAPDASSCGVNPTSTQRAPQRGRSRGGAASSSSSSSSSLSTDVFFRALLKDPSPTFPPPFKACSLSSPSLIQKMHTHLACFSVTSRIPARCASATTAAWIGNEDADTAFPLGLQPDAPNVSASFGYGSPNLFAGAALPSQHLQAPPSAWYPLNNRKTKIKTTPSTSVRHSTATRGGRGNIQRNPKPDTAGWTGAPWWGSAFKLHQGKQRAESAEGQKSGEDGMGDRKVSSVGSAAAPFLSVFTFGTATQAPIEAGTFTPQPENGTESESTSAALPVFTFGGSVPSVQPGTHSIYEADKGKQEKETENKEALGDQLGGIFVSPPVKESACQAGTEGADCPPPAACASVSSVSFAFTVPQGSFCTAGPASEIEENPSEVQLPIPMSLLTMREKTRGMVYRSEDEYRSDLTLLWQNSHRIHGNKSVSHHTLAAWVLMKVKA
uniref:Uncharacterized protein n=1 Tax=Chromera velia CCMP2878 TaxID=1169474 RepID=A0A0G4GPU0_9ALVE|eukprot:Cvel_5022.t1-p1 / transcript=Cvel_5022.t1 / gene=Cvel_5022 / organism=Chromera_velia_CCMP2878 / gene_product=hypothetical protein / transcript_product=hypothetical protein / location=Cvel_scaffold228:49952-64646(+) / protein_length=1789 / sequence_SO=supercontig / SO=protein_coding / is_pseudo=false